MPLIIKILIPGLIIVIMTAGGVIIWKTSLQSTTEISNLTPSATIKANDVDDLIIVPFKTLITLSWEFQNVDDCLISGDWFNTVSVSGSQSVGEITKPTNYILSCFDKDGKEISDSVKINIDEKTIPQEFTSNILLTDLFKDFQYLWKKDLYPGLKNDSDVVALQTALFFEGIFSSQEKITGNYDDNTFQAVKKFQENYGITPQTGYVKTQTITKLNELFYYYNYNDQLATQELSQKKIIAIKQKISSYQQQIKSATTTISFIPTSTQIIPKIITPTTISFISTSTQIIPKIITATTKPYLDLKVNNSSRSAISIQKGEVVTLTWTSKNTKSCAASGNWTGSKPTSNLTGEKTEPINKYATFKLICIGENNQNVADSVYVSIPYISPLSEDKKPMIYAVGKAGTGGLGWNLIKITGKNFDRHNNLIDAQCRLVGIKCLFKIQKIVGPDEEPNGSIPLKNEDTIEFGVKTIEEPLMPCLNFKLWVTTPQGGKSNEASYDICFD